MKKAVIRHGKGIHVRVAAMVVEKSHELRKKYAVNLFFQTSSGEKIPAGSLVPLLSSHIRAGDEIGVTASGMMADVAIDEMIDFLESDFLIHDAETIGKLDAVLQTNVITAEQIFQSIANGLIVTDENDIVTIFNPQAEKFMNLPAGEVIGKSVQDVIPDTRLHWVRQSAVPELGSRQVVGQSVLITNRTPIMVDGKARGAVGIFEDISSLENIMGQLHEVKVLKERLHLILETVQDGICVVDQQGVVSYVNPSYLRITQLTEADVLGKDIKELSPQGARAEALETGKAVLGRISQKVSGQTIVSNVTPIVVEGEVVGVVSVVKNISEVQELIDKLHKVTEQAEYFKHELRRSRKPVKAFEKFIGKSGKVLDALAIAAKAAEGKATVLISGESGTGKELVAEGIHFAGARSSGPFIRVNCAAIPAPLLESELFGHERGAFTGAVRRKPGRFELADKGTIFLDEIGEMEKNMQVKLLRVLQKQEFQRVGGEETIQVDVRIIAATNRVLEDMVASGEFREDLYYRLNVIPILLPPLRERREDILLLAEHFLTTISRKVNKPVQGIEPEALNVLVRYNWPGNVRELENIMERVITLTDHSVITVRDLPSYLQQQNESGKSDLAVEQTSILPWSEYERRIVQAALERYGSFNQAAKALGLTHKTVAAKARKYGLTRQSHWEKS